MPESRPTLDTPDTANSETIHLPLLDTVPADERKIVLTADELINETKRFMDSFKTDVDKQKTPDSVFFLLKSALPIGTMFKKLWPAFYPDTPMPKVRYINIGRKNKSELISSFDINTFQQKIDYIPPDIEAPSLEKIHEVFGKSLDQDGKILIVDEFSESGNTILAAKDVFEHAYPTAEVTTKVVYTKPPHWLSLPSYLGITDTTTRSREDEALHRVNQKFKTNFKDETDMSGDPRVLELRRTFNDNYDRLTTSPYHVEKPYDFDREMFDLAKEEQDIICSEIVKRAKLPQAA